MSFSQKKWREKIAKINDCSKIHCKKINNDMSYWIIIFLKTVCPAYTKCVPIAVIQSDKTTKNVCFLSSGWDKTVRVFGSTIVIYMFQILTI
jgi:hypothetical protein